MTKTLYQIYYKGFRLYAEDGNIVEQVYEKKLTSRQLARRIRDYLKMDPGYTGFMLMPFDDNSENIIYGWIESLYSPTDLSEVA